jgi:hypothetical protein
LERARTGFVPQGDLSYLWVKSRTKTMPFYLPIVAACLLFAGVATLPAQDALDLQFVHQLQANNTNVSLSSAGNWPAFSGTQMDFTNVASLPNGQSIDLRATVVQVIGPFFYRAIVPNFNEGDLGFLYANNGYGSGGFVLRLDFFQGGGTFSAPYVMPKLRLTFYDVDGESIQSEGVRVFREDGFSGYELPSGDQSVTLTEESGGESFLFNGPGSDRSEVDRSGAFMIDFTNTASLRLGMHSSTTGGSLNNPMFAAIDGDLSQIDPTGLAPEITQEPTDLNLLEGASGSFSVTATGAATLRYQWRKGDTTIPGATNATYTISSAQLADEDLYSVTVTNNYGAAFSRPARLNVVQQVVSPDQITLHSLNRTYSGLPQIVTASSPDLLSTDFRIEYEGPGYARTTNAPVDAGSYQLTATVVKPGFGGFKTGTLEIAPAPLTITADSFLRLVGETNPVLTYRFSGFVNGETEAVLSSPVLISTLAGTGSPIGTYDIVVSGAEAYNYAITFAGGTLEVVSGLSNVITFPALAERVYGAASFVLEATSSAGLPVAYTSSDPQIAEVAGNLVTIRGAGQVTLTARQPGNATYLPAEDVTRNLTILPKPLTVSGISAQPRDYDGTLEVALVFGAVSLAGVLDGDEAVLLTSGAVGQLNHPSPGIGKIVTVTGLQLTGADAGNYGITPPLLSVDIAPRPMSVIAADKTRSYGQPNPGLTWSFPDPGLAWGDSLEVSSITTTATSSSPPGSYPITLGPLIVRDPNGQDVTSRYTLIPQHGTLTVTKGIQEITFGALSDKTYGDPAFSLSATASSGLPVTLESSQPDILDIQGATATVKSAGTATVTARQAGSDLWEPVALAQTQVILPKGLVVAARSEEIYVGQVPTLDFDVLTPLAPGETKQSVFTSNSSDAQRHFGPGWLAAPGWNPTLTGTFPITRTHLGSPANYVITEFQPGTLTVLPGAGVAEGSVTPLAGGYDHSVLLRRDGGVSVWGSTTNGEANLPGVLTNVAGVAAGNSAKFSLAWRADGTATGWGNNSNVINTGVLQGLSGVVGMAGGDDHGVALLRDGTVRGWGGTTVPANLGATSAAGFVRVVAVAAGPSYTVALRSDGRVQYWGGNSYLSVGQELTNGAEGLYLAGITNAVGVGAGSFGVVTLQADGRVGYRGLENFGLGNLPGAVSGAGTNPVVAISAGGNHGLALLRNGQAIGWGDNGQGQINVPGTLTHVAAVAGGNTHSLLLSRDGTVTVVANANNTNRVFPADIEGARPQGGPDSDGDGWSNEAELRAGSQPLQMGSRPHKVAFPDGSLSRSLQEGPMHTPVGMVRVIDRMGWEDSSLLPGVTLLGPDAAKFRLVNGELQTAVSLDFDAPGSQTTFTLYLASEGWAEVFTLTLADDPSDNDPDADGLSTVEEIARGTDPQNPDTDSDGLSDGVESGTGVYVSGSNTGTNPLNADSDGDGRNDGQEIVQGISPLDASAYPGKPSPPPQVTVTGGQVSLVFSRILPLGANYQLQSSPNLVSWTNVGSPVQGTGGEVQFGGVSTNPKLFYRVIPAP